MGRREFFSYAWLLPLSLFLARQRRVAAAAPLTVHPGFRETPMPSDGEPPLRPTPDGRLVTETGLILDDRTAIALAAAEAAVASMPGPYSWEAGRQCSSFMSAYLSELGFPISAKTEKAANSSGLFPWSGTVRQVNWLRRNVPTYVHDAPVIDFLEGRLWEELLPGSVLYFATAISHNGYDTYYHAASLVGYHESGEPQFAELAVGMRNASAERTFKQLTKFYRRRADGSWNVTPSNPKNTLLVTWFDPLAVIRDLS